jgi:hypothetical protein
LSLFVEPEERGQRLEVHFWGEAMRDGWVVCQSEAVTPGLVRGIILVALERGWRPEGRGLGPFTLDGKEFFPDPSDPLFSARALAVLDGQRFDPTARGGFDAGSRALVWPDEFPPSGSLAAAAVSPHRRSYLLAFRAALTLAEEAPEVRPVWEQVTRHAPHWPGLRADRHGPRARHRLLAARRRADAWVSRLRGLLDPLTPPKTDQPT